MQRNEHNLVHFNNFNHIVRRIRRAGCEAKHQAKYFLFIYLQETPEIRYSIKPPNLKNTKLNFYYISFFSHSLFSYQQTFEGFFSVP